MLIWKSRNLQLSGLTIVALKLDDLLTFFSFFVAFFTSIFSFHFFHKRARKRIENFDTAVKLSLYVIIISRRSFIVNLYSIVCLNVKEILTWSRRHIWSLCDSNGIRTHNQLVRKGTLNRLSKLTIWPNWLNGWVLVYELSGCGFEFRCC